jgi:hypothetical protein
MNHRVPLSSAARLLAVLVAIVGGVLATIANLRAITTLRQFSVTRG